MNHSAAKTPFFTIVTAVKDGLGYFQKTAPTILNQSFRDYEWIIVDDSSTEPVAKYVSSLGDARVRLLQSAEQGQTKSLNQAILESKADWIVRMDADDLATLDRLEKTHAAILANPNSQLFFSNYQVIDESDSTVADIQYRQPLNTNFFKYLEKNNPICHPTVCFRKKNRHGNLNLFDVRLKNAQDYALWKAILKDTPSGLCLINSSLLKYRLVQHSLSSARAPEQISERNAIRQKLAATPALTQEVRELSPLAQQGMQAFRIAYYRFLSTTEVPYKKSSFSIIKMALLHRPIIFKTLFFIFAHPFRTFLKKLLFKGIYQ